MSASVSSTSAAPCAPPAPASAPEGIAVFKDKDRSCAACKKPDARLLCERCMWTSYCDRKCQKADWRSRDKTHQIGHKALCIPATEPEANARAAAALNAAKYYFARADYSIAIPRAQAGIAANLATPNLKAELHLLIARSHFCEGKHSIAAEAAAKGLEEPRSDRTIKKDLIQIFHEAVNQLSKDDQSLISAQIMAVARAALEEERNNSTSIEHKDTFEEALNALTQTEKIIHMRTEATAKVLQCFESAKAEYAKGEYAQAVLFAEQGLLGGWLLGADIGAALYDLIGQCKLKQALPQEAIEHFTSALAKQPTNPLLKAVLYNGLAESYVLLKQPSQALSEAQKALAAQPNDPEIEAASLHLMALAAYLLGEHQKAVECSQKALDKSSLNASDIYLTIAKASLKLLKRSEAREAAEKGLRAGPKDAEIKDTLEQICRDCEQSSSSTGAQSAASTSAESSEVKSKAEQCHDKARALFEKNSFAQAVQMAEIGLAERPLGPDVAAGLHHLIGMAQFRQGLRQEAVKSYNRGLRENPAALNVKVPLLHSLSSTYLHLNDPDRALTAAAQCLALVEANPSLLRLASNIGLEASLYHLMAQASCYPGTFAKAIEFSQKALEKNPSDRSAVYLTLANAWLKLENVDKSIEAAQKGLLANPTNAQVERNLNLITIRAAELGLQKKPTAADEALLCNIIGETAFALGQHEKALEYALRGLEKKTQNPDVQARLHLVVARYWAWRENPAEVLKAAERGLRAGPTNAAIKADLEKICRELRQSSSSTGAQSAAASSSATSSEVNAGVVQCLNEANAAFEEGDFEKAVRIAQRGLEQGPLVPDAAAALHRSIALFKLTQGKTVQAIEHLNSGLAKKPTDPVTIAALYNGLGKAYLLLPQTGKVLNAAKSALEAQPNNPEIEAASHHLIALALYKLKQYERAIESARKALDKNPSDPGVIYLTIADSYLRQFKGREALEAAENGLRARPKAETCRTSLEVVCRTVRQTSPGTNGAQSAAPSSSAKSSEANVRAKQCLVNARAEYAEGRFAQALLKAEQGLAEGPLEAEIAALLHQFIGLSKLKQDQQQQAIECFKYEELKQSAGPSAAASTSSTSSGPAHPSAAESARELLHVQKLLVQDRLTEAMQAAEETIAKGPVHQGTLAQLYLCIADARYRLCKYDEKTMEAAKKAIALGVGERDPRAFAYYFIGGCLLHLSRFEEAFKANLEAFLAKPQNTDLTTRLNRNAATIMMHRRHFAQAISIAEEALQFAKGCTPKITDPNLLAHLYCIAAHSHCELGQYDQAVKAARAALAEKPKDQELITRLGLIIKSPKNYIKEAKL